MCVTSVERSIGAQQQVVPDRGRDVQKSHSCVTSGSEVPTQSAATEVLERARLRATLAQQLQERLVLLREEGNKTKRTGNQQWRSRRFHHENEQKGQLTW